MSGIVNHAIYSIIIQERNVVLVVNQKILLKDTPKSEEKKKLIIKIPEEKINIELLKEIVIEPVKEFYKCTICSEKPEFNILNCTQHLCYCFECSAFLNTCLVCTKSFDYKCDIFELIIRQ